MGSCSHGGCILTWYQSAGALEQLACLDGACEVRFAAVPTTPFFFLLFHGCFISLCCLSEPFINTILFYTLLGKYDETYS